MSESMSDSYTAELVHHVDVLEGCTRDSVSSDDHTCLVISGLFAISVIEQNERLNGSKTNGPHLYMK